MRKIIVSEFLSLDGVMENPLWSMAYWNDEIAKFKSGEDWSTDALLLGRVTYDGFAQAWPTSTDEGAPRINAMPKYVVSNTLTNPTWNNSHVIRGNVIEEITRLKQQDGKHLLLYGSGKLAQWLMRNGLVDQYSLLIYPIVLGTGQRLFAEGSPQSPLKLLNAQTFSNGVTAMVYEPERGAV
ncbi:MAG: dihydrofolate reductase family protein [Chloroflexaceae bacterium]|nr:dihydrofolate reductase family protein [Chloroflexaceae bacterium]